MSADIDVEALDVTALVGKWRNASDAARASEHHWPADCLAEAAEVVTRLAAHDAEVRRTAAKETAERITQALEAEARDGMSHLSDSNQVKRQGQHTLRYAARIARAEADQ